MNSKKITTAIIIFMMVWCFDAASLNAETVRISPSKDNTLYEDAEGDVSNGVGWYFFVGRTGQTFPSPNVSKRRAVMAFNITDSIPSGSTIQSVTLTLNLSNSPLFTPSAETISIRKLLGDWGEGASDALFAEGSGAVAATNDATWLYQFYNTNSWTNAGGDFSVTASGNVAVDSIRSYTVASTNQMVADVQNWLDIPAANFGWLLLGDESVTHTARRFDSKDHPTVANRPILTVTYLPPPCCIGIRGDIDGNGITANVQDLTYMINDIFRGGPASPCPEEADLNSDSAPSTIQDLTYLINDIFRGGPASPACP